MGQAGVGRKKGSKAVVDNMFKEFGGKREERDWSTVGEGVWIKGDDHTVTCIPMTAPEADTPSYDNTDILVTEEQLETYLSSKPDMVFRDDSIKFPMECLHRAFSEGHIKGDLLIDISYGSFIHHLYTPSEYFKQILVLKCSEQCIMELNKWINTLTGAFDWSHIIEYIKCLEGNSDQCQDKDMTLKTEITKIMKCDIDNENLTDPEVLPPADCVISIGMLDIVSKDQDDYINNFKKFVKLLKPEGYLILIGLLNTTFMMVGQDKIHVFRYEEKFARKVLTDEGFVIDHCVVQKRTIDSDLTDYEALMFTTAHRE
ncbi:indolethylamine N-methyltransferase-like [Pseudophryne corroboree]|uniref:indolethylamine N-methyltransferase-like n=1 Tax=Pseudophryne corroboree TaxID=495146 RepID=UPI0030821779